MLVLHINNHKNNKLILQQNRCLSPKPRDPRKRGKKLIKDAQNQALRLLGTLFIIQPVTSTKLVSKLKDDLSEFIKNTEKAS
jgi:hypothetical protein